MVIFAIELYSSRVYVSFDPQGLSLLSEYSISYRKIALH